MICFLLTTYKREEPCKRLVTEVSKYGDVFILSDGSQYDVDDSWSSKYPVYFGYQDNIGKQRYTETVNTLFAMPKKKYEYYFVLQDDYYPTDNFIEKTLSAWKKIKDERKISLCLLVDKSRLGKHCWTGFTPVEYPDYRLTQWVEMCFMCEQRFFDELVEIPRPNIDWVKNPQMSSGVGSFMSKYFKRHKWNMYQTKVSTFITQPEARISRMHPWRLYNDPINTPIL